MKSQRNNIFVSCITTLFAATFITSCHSGNQNPTDNKNDQTIPIFNTRNVIVNHVNKVTSIKQFNSTTQQLSYKCDEYGGVNSITQRIPVALPKNTEYKMGLYLNCENGTQFDITNDAQWKSYNPDVFTVSHDGILNSINKGTTALSYKFNDIEIKTNIDITDPRLAGVTISTDKTTIAQGEKTKLTATAIYSDGDSETLPHYDVSWTSMDHNVANVDLFGFVYASNTGNATIKALHSNRSGTIQIEVTPAVIKSIYIDPISIRMNSIISNEQEIRAYATYSDSSVHEIDLNDLSCILNDQSIIKSNPKQTCNITLATSGAHGDTNIKVSYKGFESSGVFSVVRSNVEALEIIGDSDHSIMNGDSYNYKIYAKIGNAYYDETNNIKLSSYNANIASIEQPGEIKANSYGTTSLHAVFKNDISGHQLESIIQLYVDDITIVPSPESNLYTGHEYTPIISFKDAKNNKTYTDIRPVEFTSNDNSKLEVKDNKLYPISAGSVILNISTPMTKKAINKVYNINYGQQKVYIANSTLSGLQIEMCHIKNKSLENCQNALDIPIAGKTYAITISPDNKFAYIGTGEDLYLKGNGIYRCNINQQNMLLNNCKLISANDINNRTMYISQDSKYFIFNNNNLSGGTITKCNYNQNDGDINNCITTYNDLHVNRFSISNLNKVLYFASGKNLKHCTLKDSDLSITSCTNISDTGYFDYGGISYNNFNNYGYFLTTTPFIGRENLSDKILLSRTTSSVLNSTTTDLKFIDDNTAIASRIGAVYTCDVNSSGNIESCTRDYDSKSTRAENIAILQM